MIREPFNDAVSIIIFLDKFLRFVLSSYYRIIKWLGILHVLVWNKHKESSDGHNFDRNILETI